jgi:hypothetical protein
MTKEARMKRIAPLCLSLALIGACPLAALAAEPAAPAQQMPGTSPDALDAPQPVTKDGVTFVSGGIGDGGRAAMDKIAHDYNLRLMFAQQKTGEYLADIGVTITNAAGKTILATTADGPFFYARVPPGRYKVTATSAGASLTRDIAVSAKGAARQSFYWPKSS